MHEDAACAVDLADIPLQLGIPDARICKQSDKMPACNKSTVYTHGVGSLGAKTSQSTTENKYVYSIG